MNHKIHNEHQLLKELRSGNAQAFEQIFRTYWKELYEIAVRKLQSHAEAEEIVQGIFSTLWEKRKVLLINDLSHYLKAAVKNRILNVIRANITKEKYWNYYKTFIPSTEETTEVDVVFEALDNAVQEAVSLLPEKSREVFRLSRMEGKSNAEIANILEVSEKAIEYHLTKSLRALKGRLKQYIT